MGELLFNVLLLLFFVVMGAYSFDIKIVDEHSGARYWPLVMICAIILLICVKIAQIWKALPKEERKFSLDIFKFNDSGVQRLLLSLGWLFLYILALPYGGYALSTILFFAGMAWLIGARKVSVIALSSIGITIAVWAVFVWGLDVHPPRGIGFLEKISIWLEYLI
jgi:hypothetical protein